MRKAALWLLALCLLTGALALPAAAAKKKKKPPAPQPVPVVLYMHGTQTLGEADYVEASANGVFMKMDTTEGSGEKSVQFLNYVAGPNSECAGNSIFPVWIGDVAGTIVGDVKVTFGTVATPGDVQVRLWPDQVGQACNADYPVAARDGNVAVGAGPATTEAVLSGLDFSPTIKLMLQINAVIGGTVEGRIMYDTADAKVEFMCIPPAGKTSCTP